MEREILNLKPAWWIQKVHQEKLGSLDSKHKDVHGLEDSSSKSSLLTYFGHWIPRHCTSWCRSIVQQIRPWGRMVSNVPLRKPFALVCVSKLFPNLHINNFRNNWNKSELESLIYPQMNRWSDTFQTEVNKCSFWWMSYSDHFCT